LKEFLANLRMALAWFFRSFERSHSASAQAGVAATTIARLARNDQKVASALSLELVGKIVTVLDCWIEDLLEVIEG